MVESMVERVARAICENEHNLWSETPPDVQGIYLDLARISIEAMREPTDAMIDAGVAMALQALVHGQGGWSAYIADLHRQMIDAALNEQIAG